MESARKRPLLQLVLNKKAVNDRRGGNQSDSKPRVRLKTKVMYEWNLYSPKMIVCGGRPRVLVGRGGEFLASP